MLKGKIRGTLADEQVGRYAAKGKLGSRAI
jgi:hypothetical protein